MKIYALSALLLSLLAISCKQTINKQKNSKLNQSDVKAIKKSSKPVWGYRFVITGNFYGDGKTDTLTEHFYSALTDRETYKYSGNAPSYDAQVDSVNKKKVYCFLSSSDKRVKPLMIDSAQGEFGLKYLKNEGDLDGDGTDDISFIIDFADWSSVHFCDIMSFKKGKWQRIYYFETRDWEFPDLPDVNYDYGSFNFYKMTAHFDSDSANRVREKELKAFPGLIKKVAYNKVLIHHVDIEGKDTIYVDLRPGHHRKSDQRN